MNTACRVTSALTSASAALPGTPMLSSRGPTVVGALVPIGAPVSIAGPCAIGSAVKTLHPNVTNLYRESRSFFSNEINLISTVEGPLQWLLGVYQYQENSDQPGQIQYLRDEPLTDFYFDPVLGVVGNPERHLQYFRNTSLFHAYGVYGQVDYQINDQFKLTGGLRWSKDIN